ncbi:MAG: histone-like protein [Candidatus Nanohaloarchaea archaeon]
MEFSLHDLMDAAEVKDLETDEDVEDVLENVLEEKGASILDEAAEKARENDRKTLLGRDIRRVSLDREEL